MKQETASLSGNICRSTKHRGNFKENPYKWEVTADFDRAIIYNKILMKLKRRGGLYWNILSIKY